jgi:hypothetical protein
VVGGHGFLFGKESLSQRCAEMRRSAEKIDIPRISFRRLRTIWRLQLCERCEQEGPWQNDLNRTGYFGPVITDAHFKLRQAYQCIGRCGIRTLSLC